MLELPPLIRMRTLKTRGVPAALGFQRGGKDLLEFAQILKSRKEICSSVGVG